MPDSPTPTNRFTAADAEAICRAVAPREFKGVPVYPVLTSEVPDLAIRPSILGFAGPDLDLQLQQTLSALGRWQDRRGAALVLNDLRANALALKDADGDEEFAAELARNRLTAHTLHEMAHNLNQPIGSYNPPAPIAENFFAAQAAELVDWCDRGPQEMPLPFDSHGADYVRVLCHVLERAGNAGILYSLSHAFNSKRYSLSPIWPYQNALKSELETFDGLLFDLPSIQPPREFADLWLSDLRKFADDRGESSRQMRDIIDAARHYPTG